MEYGHCSMGDALLHTLEFGYKRRRTATQVLTEMQALGLEEYRYRWVQIPGGDI